MGPGGRGGVVVGVELGIRYDPFTRVLNEQSEKQSAVKLKERLVI